MVYSVNDPSKLMHKVTHITIPKSGHNIIYSKTIQPFHSNNIQLQCFTRVYRVEYVGK